MKIGILTHYYQSPNYGGNLQAYALVEFLKSAGYDAEQICYNIFFTRRHKKTSFADMMTFLVTFPVRLFHWIIKKTLLANRFTFVREMQSKRFLYIKNFNQGSIAHSNKIYDYNDIDSANEIYDTFITGSDQVWHPHNFCPAYLLTFVKKGKKKISYAASIAKSALTVEEINQLSSSILDYTSISVREQDSATLLESKINRSIFCALDPVFLLSKEKWNSILQPIPIEEPYMLTYFLGNNKEARKMARRYAHYKNIKLVSMPYLKGKYRGCDWMYGDEQIFEAGPEHFISLIKNASYVFTDSFHATAFSLMFEKKFFVFPRDTKKSQVNRINYLLELSNCLDQFSLHHFNLNEIKIDNVFNKMKIDFKRINEEIDMSKQFLLDALIK